MVALSFKSQFEAPVAAGLKLQTIRANRKRNPRVGDRLQLYVGMRTKQCRKIRPDVVCTAVWPIEIWVSRLMDSGITSVAINGIYLRRGEIERLAQLDGFPCQFWRDGEIYPARRAMGKFWLDTHGEGRFEGVLIRWSLS